MKELKHIRVDRGMYQAELAQMLGVTQSSVAQWESGAVMPQGVLLPKIADALGCTIDALYGREPPAEAS